MNLSTTAPLALVLLALSAAPLPADVAGGTPINALPFNASTAGRYYLTGNLTIADGNAIQVLAHDIEIDLCGYSITNTGTASVGVLDVGFENVRVRNGVVDGFEDGIRLNDGATVSDVVVRNSENAVVVGYQALVERVRVFDLTQHAIFTDGAAVVRDCSVDGTGSQSTLVQLGEESSAQRVKLVGGSIGLIAAARSVVEDCSAIDFSVEGLRGSSLSTLIRCSASEGTFTDANLGIVLGNGSRAIQCSVRGPNLGIDAGFNVLIEAASIQLCDTGIRARAGVRVVDTQIFESGVVGIEASGFGIRIEDSSVRLSLGDGIAIDSFGGLVRGCTVFLNNGGGITAVNGVRVEDNTCSSNAGAGLRCVGDGNRVERNTLSANAWGLVVEGRHNLLVGNRATQSTIQDYVIAPKNPGGPFLTTSGWIQGSYPQANYATPLF